VSHRICQSQKKFRDSNFDFPKSKILTSKQYTPIAGQLKLTKQNLEWQKEQAQTNKRESKLRKGGKLVREQGAGSREQGFRGRGAGISYPNFYDFLLL
jgi:hypothetical protein